MYTKLPRILGIFLIVLPFVVVPGFASAQSSQPPLMPPIVVPSQVAPFLTAQDNRQVQICNDMPAGTTSAACINLNVKVGRLFLTKTCTSTGADTTQLATACDKAHAALLSYKQTFCSDPNFSPNLEFCTPPQRSAPQLSTSISASAQWYIANAPGGHECESLQRFRPSFNTPQDYANWLREFGIVLVPLSVAPTLRGHMLEWKGTNNGQTLYYTLFNNLNICKAQMHIYNQAK